MSESVCHEARKPTEEDLYIARQIRHHRKRLKLSMEALAAGMGIAYQQVQKYETGANRVSFHRLVQITKALRISLADLIGEEYLGVQTISTSSLVREEILSDLKPPLMELLKVLEKHRV